MLRPHLVGVGIGFVVALTMSSTSASATPCTNLQSLQLEHTTINSATDNMSGVFVVPGSNPPQTLTGLPAFCRVTATLTPTSDSAIKIEVWLPESNTWNGRFLGTGGGGFQGVITYSELALGLASGYASANSDLGTGASGCNPLFCGSNGNQGNALAAAFGDPANPSTGLFGHPERIKDFGYRAIHLMTVQGKQITDAFYQQGANKAYFAGCSTGGQNALMEAQRFPNDYDGSLAGAPAVNGQLINPGSERGNETDDVRALGLALQEQLPEPAFDGLFYWVYGASFGMPGSTTNFANFDFHHDVDTVDDQLEKVLNATSTDLSEFREHGGKLILYHGWADPLIPSQSSINYFNALVKYHDQEFQPAAFDTGRNPNLQRTQSHARLFMVPGMYHCSGGPGPNTFDALTPLVNWVEKGTAPDSILATKFVNDTPPTVAMTRPLCVFPKVAKYNGSGSTDMAQNFTCVTDEPDFNQTPAPKFGP